MSVEVVQENSQKLQDHVWHSKGDEANSGDETPFNRYIAPLGDALKTHMQPYTTGCPDVTKMIPKFQSEK
jgi:hypothetical protein